MALSITVYAKPSCAQCDATKRKLTEKGLPFQIDDALEENNLTAIKYLGFMGAPFVLVTYPDNTEDMWSGYRPDKIDEIIAKVAEL